jgi:phage terminase small subunit
MMKLTPKQKKFADEYLIDLNATAAYKRAEYKVKSDNAAGVNANRLLRNAKIQKYIQERMNQREKRTEITQDRVLKELAKIGFANIDDYLKIDAKEYVIGYEDDDDPDAEHIPIKHYAKYVDVFQTDSVDKDKLGAVSEIKQTKEGISIKLHDKVAALEKIGKHLGMFKDGPLAVVNIHNPYEGLSTEDLKKMIRDG